MTANAVRFRPVVMRVRLEEQNGGPPAAAMAYPLFETPDGLSLLREFDGGAPVRAPLERVSVADLPPPYQQPGLEVMIGPIEVVMLPEDKVLDYIDKRLDELTAEAIRDVDVRAPQV